MGGFLEPIKTLLLEDFWNQLEQCYLEVSAARGLGVVLDCTKYFLVASLNSAEYFNIDHPIGISSIGTKRLFTLSSQTMNENDPQSLWLNRTSAWPVEA